MKGSGRATRYCQGAAGLSPKKSDKAYGAIYTNTIAANSRLLKCLGKCVIDTNRLVPEKITFKTLWALLLLGALVDE